MKKSSLVSIIIPTYNGGKYINRALDSILEQDYSPIELIVVNDGSTDNVLKILESYIPKFEKINYKFKIINQKNRGVSSAFNTGLKQFTGDFLTFLADDDWLKLDSISQRVNFLKKNKQFDMVYCAVDVVDEGAEDRVVFTRDIKEFPSDNNLFINLLLERDYYYGGLAHLIRADYFLKIHPQRQIADFKAGQNIQIFLPLYYRGQIGHISRPVATILQRQDSHSRKERSEEEWGKRFDELHRISIDTLNKIDMPEHERKNYLVMIEDRFEKANYIRSLNDQLIIKDKEILVLNNELEQLFSIRKSARRLVGNIKRKLMREDDKK